MKVFPQINMFNKLLIAAVLSCLSLVEGYAQKKANIQTVDSRVNAIDDKLDAVDDQLNKILHILNQGYNLKSHSDSVFKIRVSAIERHYQGQIDSLKTVIIQANENITSSRKKASTLKKDLDGFKNSTRKDIKKLILPVFSSSTIIGLNSTSNYRLAAKKYAPDLLDSIDEFISLFKEVQSIQAQFEDFSDFSQFNETLMEAYLRTKSYPGLSAEIKKIRQLLKGYCKKENELILLLKQANTQVGMESYQKNIRRRKDKFSDYPKLVKIIDEALKDRNYKFIPCCEENKKISP